MKVKIYYGDGWTKELQTGVEIHAWLMKNHPEVEVEVIGAGQDDGTDN